MKGKELIKTTIVEVSRELGVGLEEVILFGSRARGDFRKDSDLDVLIITERELSWRERLRLSGEIRKKLAKRGMPVDVLIISRKRLESLKNDPGYVYSYALSEGIRI